MQDLAGTVENNKLDIANPASDPPIGPGRYGHGLCCCAHVVERLKDGSVSRRTQGDANTINSKPKCHCPFGKDNPQQF